MNFSLRLSEPEDIEYPKKWLEDREILRFFPMSDTEEIEDAMRIWKDYILHKKSSLTALCGKEVIGMSLLYVSPWKKLQHQSLFVIIISPEWRGKGVGQKLLLALMDMAKEKFHIHILHLEVYEDNPAVEFYKKLGFVAYGKHPHFLKQEGKYIDKLLMQKHL